MLQLIAQLLQLGFQSVVLLLQQRLLQMLLGLQGLKVDELLRQVLMALDQLQAAFAQVVGFILGRLQLHHQAGRLGPLHHRQPA